MLKNFIKGIAVGLGGIAPGLSGSVLLVIFGLYEKTVNAISTLFKNFKKNISFLVPLGAGMAIGVVLFSKLVNYLLDTYYVQTHYAFLGLILGAVPLFYKEVKKKGFSGYYYIVMGLSFTAGFLFFLFNQSNFKTVTDPNLWQSVLLGFAVAGSSIVPGIDSAAILNAFGLYEIWVKSISDMDFNVLIPAAGGLIVGIIFFSLTINRLLKHFYTATFSVIFGLFLSVIPGILDSRCTLAYDVQSAVAIILMVAGFLFSFFFSDLDYNLKRLKVRFKK